MPSLSILIIASLTIACSHSLSTPSAKSSTRSYVEVIEPETGCQVVLLGCLHGSESSAADVRELLNTKTNAVVLELCASRLEDLRRVQQSAPIVQETSGLRRYISMVLKTNEKRGFATASAAAVLGGVSGLQTAMSNFEPGLEFLTAMEIADRDNCDLILADRTVEETLRRMGKLPLVSWSMLQSLFKERSWKDTFGQDATALSEAIFGDTNMDECHQVQMGSVLTRNKAVVEDLVRGSLPPIILSALLANILTNLLALFFPQDAAVNIWTLVTDVTLTQQEAIHMLMGLAGESLYEVLTLLVGYIIVALPAARVILSERDEYLTRGIQAACRLESNSSEPRRVVAVLGLLHVNGVAKQLLSKKV